MYRIRGTVSYKINVECPQSCWMFALTSVSWFFTLLLLSDSNKQTAEKAMAPHSSTLAWKIPWTEEPHRLRSTGSLRVRHDWATSLSCIGEGNGNPLQCSCLENPRDGGSWWAAVYGVAQSRTRLKRLSSSNSSSSPIVGTLKHNQVLLHVFWIFIIKCKTLRFVMSLWWFDPLIILKWPCSC